MAAKQAELNEFIERRGLNYEAHGADGLLDAFLSEMDRGLAGEDSSLAMIPTFVGSDSDVLANQPVIVLDAGGTNLRVAVVTFNGEGHPVIDSFRKFRMPGFERELSKEAFFTRIVEHLEPVLDEAARIGFCFSYPTEITPDKDGRLIKWTKEIKAPDVVGEYMGASVKERLKARGYDMDITVLNDTVATLLAGKSMSLDRQYSSYVGFILGTGTNTAYIESNANISKRDDLELNGRQVVNVESGGFDQLPRSDADDLFDQGTADPGKYRLEKMISGAYMGGVALKLFYLAAEDNLLSESAVAEIKSWGALHTKDMDDFVWNPFRKGPFGSPAFSEADIEVLYVLCRTLIQRAAWLAAINISAAVVKSGAGKEVLHPVCINVDGSTYYKTKNLQSLVEAHLRTMLGECGVHFELVHVDEAPVLGAAVAGLIG